MSEIVNLRQARKRKRRDDAGRTAEANRVLHGLSKAEKRKREGLREIEERRHAAHRRPTLPDSGD